MQVTTNPDDVRTDVDLNLAYLGESIVKRAALQEKINARIAKVQAQYASDLAELDNEIERYQTAISEAVAEHPDALDDGKLPGLTSGDVRVVNLPPKVVVEDPDGLLARLRESGNLDCIRLGKDSVDKTALKKKKPTVEGYSVVSGQAVGIKPNLTGKEVRVPLTEPTDA